MRLANLLFVLMFAIIVFGTIIFLANRLYPKEVKMKDSISNYSPGQYEVATFAGGCFWCIEAAYELQEGVIEAVSGYTGGTVENPTYETVSSGDSGHFEALQVYFLPEKISYEMLLEIFWLNIDPTDAGGQFSDRGPQYRTAIFYSDEKQRISAEASKRRLEESGMYEDKIVTQILPLGKFYPAEEYHQDYYLKQSSRYNTYKTLSGREDFVKKNEKIREDNLKTKLTPMQYSVTQECSTEPTFNNEYWDNHDEGIYVDIVTGQALFSSKDKFDSGTGWPSFTRPIDDSGVIKSEDESLGMLRTEVSSLGGSHLGHVFDDGPDGNLRYCINSASLRFIQKDDMQAQGYGDYLYLFE